MRFFFGVQSVLIVVFALIACGGDPPAAKPKTILDDDFDGTTRDPACSRACKVLAALHCPEGDAPDGGKPCVQVCSEAHANNLAALPADCVQRQKTAEGVRACGVACR